MRSHLIKSSCLFVLSGILLSGCWNRTELNELGITTATGYDREEDQWQLTYQVVVPSALASATGGGGGGSQAGVHVFSSKADSIREAANLSNLENPRRLYFAHNNVVVLGKKTAEYGISELVDTFFRSSESRETVFLLVTENTARDILQKLVPPEKLPGFSISGILRKESQQTSIYPQMTLYEFALKMTSDSKGVAVPVIGAVGDINPENQEELESLDVIKRTSPPLKLALTKMAIFEGDKMVGTMNRDESFGLSWITGKVQGTVISFPKGDGKVTERSSIQIASSHTKVTPVIEGDHITMKINVKAQGQLMESSSLKDISKKETIDELRKQIEQVILDDIDDGWRAVQRLKVDVIGFADIIHRKHPKEWKKMKKNWKQELPQIKLDVKVNVTIKRPGQIQKSIRSIQENQK